MSETQVDGGRGRKVGRWVGFLAAGVLGALAGNTLLSVARADFGGFGPRHGGFFRHHGGDPARMGEHAQMAVEMAFRAVGASDEQRTQARAIVARHLDDAKALHERHLANRKAGVEALSGATVDREKLESVRRAQIDLADEASKKLTVALADLADVLTPEQRVELIELGARFHR